MAWDVSNGGARLGGPDHDFAPAIFCRWMAAESAQMRGRLDGCGLCRRQIYLDHIAAARLNPKRATNLARASRMPRVLRVTKY